MKNRFTPVYGQRVLIRVVNSNPPTWTYNVYRELDSFDSLTQTGYSGPKTNPLGEHSQTISKTLTSDYTGVESESNSGYSQQNSGLLHGWGGGPSYSLPSQANAYNTALSRLYGEIRSSTDLSVTAAQWRQTQRMFKDSLTDPIFSSNYATSALVAQNRAETEALRRRLRDTRITRGYAHRELERKSMILSTKFGMKVGRLHDFVTRFRPREWADRWLEYQYGWRPLVQDVYNTGKQLMDLHSYSLVRVFGTATDRSKATRNITTNGVNVNEQTYGNVRVKICGVFALSNSRIQRLSNYTSLNPASIAWELLPYSFVVDWLVDVGGYLRSLESEQLFRNDFRSGWSVTGTQVLAFAQKGGGFPIAGGSYAVSAKASSYYRTKSRAVLSSLNPRRPEIGLRLGWERATSGASLLSQFLKK